MRQIQLKMLQFFLKFHFGKFIVIAVINLVDQSNSSLCMFYRWFNRLAGIGRERELNEDDMYAATDGMRSAQNTDAFAREWQIELEKTDPSVVRVIFRLYGFKALSLTFLYAVGSTIAGYV